MGGPPRGRGAARQGGHALGIEGIKDIADRLIVAAQGLANHAGRLTTGTGKQDLATAQHKGIGRTQPLLQGVLFVLGQRTDIDRFSHTTEYTTFPNTLRWTALGPPAAIRLSRLGFNPRVSHPRSPLARRLHLAVLGVLTTMSTRKPSGGARAQRLRPSHD